MEIINLTNWKETKAFIDNCVATDEFIWRGQSSAEWEISSSLYRYFEAQKIDPEERLKLEIKSIENFRDAITEQNFAENIIGNNVIQISDIMVLMQHYGCPTRLLDWTRSPYIAAYFSIMDMEKQAAIYGINLTKYQEIIRKTIPLSDYDGSLLVSLHNKTIQTIIEDDQFISPVPFVPNKLSNRDSIQQSAFLMDSNLALSTEKNIISSASDCLIKIIFSKQLRQTIHNDLILMNIDSFMLFQNLTGIALKAKEFLNGELKKFGHSTEKIAQQNVSPDGKRLCGANRDKPRVASPLTQNG